MVAHSEALVLSDALLPSAVMAQVDDPSALTPLSGLFRARLDRRERTICCTGGQASNIAVHIEGGWRFAPPVAGMRLFDRAANVVRHHDGTAWVASSAIIEPTGGAMVDAEARATLGVVLTAFREMGLLPVT